MILGSDSHTRYGALGTIAVGEGGGELDKQILGDTWDNPYPGVVAIYLTGKPAPWVGPHDIALAICRAVYEKGYVKNKIMEFVGPGVSSMTTDYRNGVDVMTTETTCLSSIWRTDSDTKDFLKEHGRESDYKELNPADVAYYDGCVYVDLSTIKPMIALPFHPSNAYEIDELNANLMDILRETEKKAEKVAQGRAQYTLTDKVKDGKFMVQQGVIGGCAGGNYTNVVEAANLLRGKSIGAGEFTLNIYPSSMPVYMDLAKKGFLTDFMASGAVIKTAFCGPCFGAGDTPNNNGFSIRHNTRNFPNREGSKPGQGQMSAVALMDSRSIAATAANGGALTSAETFADTFGHVPSYHFDDSAYKARVYEGFGKAEPKEKLYEGPNIKAWPELPALGDNILLRVCSKIEERRRMNLFLPGKHPPIVPIHWGLPNLPCRAVIRSMWGGPKRSRNWNLPVKKAKTSCKRMPMWQLLLPPSTPFLAVKMLLLPIRKSVLSFTPINRVMAVLVNRQPAVSASSVALPTSLVNMRPNGIAATSSTGGCCPFI